MHQILRKALGLSLAAALGVGVVAAVAFAGPGNRPAITFASSSPVEGATLTSNSATFAFSYNRTMKQTRSLVCSLSGPSTSLSAPCDHLVNITGGAQADKSYSNLANGSYTFTASLTLTDDGTAAATRHFSVNVPPVCSVVNTRTATSYNDLQAAIDAASAGDELDITGICTGNYVVVNNLALKGIDTAGVQATLDGNATGRVITVGGLATVSIDNLRITNGHESHAAGGGIFNFGTLTISGSTITDNAAEGDTGNGGGINTVGPLTVTGTTISDNTAEGDGGGIHIGGVSSGAPIPVTITSSTISGNRALGGNGGGDGGGVIILDNFALNLIDTSITGNSAGTAGGGLWVEGRTVSGTGSTSVSGNTPDNCLPLNIIPGCNN